MRMSILTEASGFHVWPREDQTSFQIKWDAGDWVEVKECSINPGARYGVTLRDDGSLEVRRETKDESSFKLRYYTVEKGVPEETTVSHFLRLRLKTSGKERNQGR